MELRAQEQHLASHCLLTVTNRSHRMGPSTMQIQIIRDKKYPSSTGLEKIIKEEKNIGN
jgi:hypothetical protein